MNIITLIKKHFIFSDTISCFVAVFLIFVCDLKFNWKLFVFLSQNDGLKKFYADLFAVSITIFVFLITSMSILFAFSENKKLESIKNTPHPETMFKVFVNATICVGLQSLALIPTYFIPTNEWLFWTIVLFTLIALARLARVIWILNNLTFIVLKL